MADLPNPIFSIAFFSGLTFAFFIIKYYLATFNKIQALNPNESFLISICFYIYVGMVIFSQLFLNLGLTYSLCGTTQWETAMFVTFVPWLLIFMLLKILLDTFPGWTMPFSNTFGYLLVKLMGIRTIINKYFINEKATSKVNKLLSKFYTDPSVIINQAQICIHI